MMVKALVFDIDGTLTVKKNQMSSMLREKLQKLREQGMQIIMATGRPVTDLMAFQKENCFFTPAVVLNGAAVLDDGEMSCCQYLQGDCVSRIMEQLVAHDLPFVCYQKENNVVIDSSRGSYANVMQHYLPEANLQPLFESFVSYKADTFDKERVLKIETCFPDLQQIAHVRKQLLNISGINVVRSMHFNLEMSDQQANKGKNCWSTSIRWEFKKKRSSYLETAKMISLCLMFFHILFGSTIDKDIFYVRNMKQDHVMKMVSITF